MDVCSGGRERLGGLIVPCRADRLELRGPLFPEDARDRTSHGCRIGFGGDFEDVHGRDLHEGGAFPGRDPAGGLFISREPCGILLGDPQARAYASTLLIRRMDRARPVSPSISSSTPLRWAGPLATSNRAGSKVRNRWRTSSRPIPIMESLCPYIPTSVMNAVPPGRPTSSATRTCVMVHATYE